MNAPPPRPRARLRPRGLAPAALIAVGFIAAPIRSGVAGERSPTSPIDAAPALDDVDDVHDDDDDDDVDDVDDDVAGIALVATGGGFVVGGGALAALGAVVESQDDPPHEPTNATPWWLGAGASAVVGASMLALGVVLLVDGDDATVTARIAPTRADVVVRF